MDGLELCREVRELSDMQVIKFAYLILLTAKNNTADILAGLRSGADDYVTKPFEPEELRARVRVGQRIIKLQESLTAQQTALENALTREKVLQQRVASLEGRGQQETAKSASA